MINLNKNNKKEIIEYPKEIFGNTLLELGKSNEKVVFISCDTSLGSGAKEFKKSFPERHIELGIQEQNAMTVAAGLAISGKISFISAHIPFIVLKCIDQIRDDLCKTNLNVNIIGRDFGFQLSSLGPSHMIFEDVGLLRTLPNITIIAPADGLEYKNAIKSSLDIDGPVYIRLSRQPVKRINNENYNFQVGKGVLLNKGKDVTIIATSTMVSRAYDAINILKSQGIDVDLINIHTIKPIDKDIILESASKTKNVVTIEEHSIINGLGSAVAEILIEENPVRMKRLGTRDCFTVSGGDYEGLLDYYGLTKDKIAKSVEDFILDLK